MTSIEFPVFLLLRDCAEIQRYSSFDDLLSHLEKIDVENHGYLAWDKHGQPVSLGIQPEPTLQVANNDLALTWTGSWNVREPMRSTSWSHKPLD